MRTVECAEPVGDCELLLVASISLLKQ